MGCRGSSEEISVETTVPIHLMTEPLEFVSQMQHAALEIDDHQVIRRRVSQSLIYLLFEGFLPPFKMNNMIRFCHDYFPTPTSCFSNGRAGAPRGGGGEEGQRSSHRKRPLITHLKKLKPLKARASPVLKILVDENRYNILI
jgi:hypothetical protein